MPNNKRKREPEESQAHKDGHHKQKKRRKSDTKVTVEPQATSGSKSQDITRKSQASATVKKQAAKTQAQQRGLEDNHKIVLGGDGASRGVQTGEQTSKDDPSSAGQVAEVIPEDQAAKTQRRREVRRQEKEKETETTKTQQHDQSQTISDTIKNKKPTKKKERKRSDIVLENPVAEATAEEQMAKELKRKLWPIKNKEKGDQVSMTEKKAKRAIKDQKKLAKRARRRSKQKSSAPTWRISEAIGGCMLSIDPIISPEEDCILIAYDKSVHVYSISTSLLLRKLRVKSSEQISSFALSPSDTTQLLLSRWSGIIEKWDWTNGSLLDMWDTKTHVRLIATSKLSFKGNNTGLIYTVDRSKGKRWMITAHRLMRGENASKSDLGTLLKYEEPISSLQVFEEGKVIVATSGQKILIGSTEDPDKPALKNVSYIWREITCSEWITSIDTRIRPADNSTKNIRPSKVTTSAVDVVVGGLKGAMFIYEDLLGRLISKENSSKSGVEDNMTPRKLHWHRNAVSSVKWSADGNYVISGGHETVLVIWQLDTGHKQELPHLSAAIESLVVSPTGTSYGIRLADNSAMILSTTELLPIFSVAGIQLPGENKSTDIELPFIPTINVPTESSLSKKKTGLHVVASSKASQILLAVPADTSSAISSRHACFLQTIDVNSAQQISRQALARNKVTALNMGPEQNIIDEPIVTHMQLSHNGLWLATAEEWMPPERDLDHLAFDHQRTNEEQSSRLEVYLKFWAWDDDSTSWELVSRINNPQQTLSGSTGSVVDLATDPVRVGFATVGEDGVIKLWKPQTRKRHGLDVRDKEGKSLTSWDCRWTTHTPSARSSSSKISQTTKLAFSPDSSVLVAGVSGTSIVHFIDTSSGILHSSLNAMFTGPLYGLCIIDRYLITLSKELRVWDIVTEELHYGFTINANVSDPKKRLAHTHLAVDQKYNIFAIAFPELGATSEVRLGSLRSRIAVFDVEVPEPVYNNLQPNLTTSLLPISGKKGFHCIDTAAEVKTLSAGPKIPDVLVEQPGKQRGLALGLGNIYGDGKADEERREVLKLTSGNIQVEEGGEDDMRVVSPEKLAEVFEAGSAFALPPVSELFERVAVLFAGRKGS